MSQYPPGSRWAGRARLGRDLCTSAEVPRRTSPGSSLNSGAANPGAASGPQTFEALLSEGSAKPRWLRASSLTADCSRMDFPSARTHVDPIDLSLDFASLSHASPAAWAEAAEASNKAKSRVKAAFRFFPRPLGERRGARRPDGGSGLRTEAGKTRGPELGEKLLGKKWEGRIRFRLGSASPFYHLAGGQRRAMRVQAATGR